MATTSEPTEHILDSSSHIAESEEFFPRTNTRVKTYFPNGGVCWDLRCEKVPDWFLVLSAYSYLRGYCALQIRKAVNKLPGCRFAEIHVARDGTLMLRLYTEAGFVIDGALRRAIDEILNQELYTRKLTSTGES